MATIFSRIIAGEIPCYKVAEDDRFFAFLDINPLKRGHTLVVPKQEVDYLFDLEDETLAAMTVFAKKVAKKIEREIACSRVAVVVLGLEVPHARLPLPSFGHKALSLLSALPMSSVPSVRLSYHKWHYLQR